MRIGFYAASCLPIKANSIEERPLGGTETGVVRVAEILARRKHDVVVFTSMKNPPLSIPQYVPQSYIQTSGRFDVLVLLKDWKPAVFNISSNRIFYWTGDGFDQYINFGFGDARVVKRIEKFLSVSKWQAATMCEKSGFPFQKTFFVGNGAHLPYFEGEEERARKRLIFTAAPYRGLALMPKIFLMVKESHPSAELHVFSGMSVYDTDKPFQGPHVAEFERIGSVLKKIPGVVMHGNVTQKVLARELMKASVFVYPNIIFETCCINAIEAQAAGCPVVASRNSGLVETVQNAGILIDETPGSEAYISAFVDAVNRLLENDKLWTKLSQNALNRAKTQLSWEHVANRFEAEFNQ